MHDVINLLDELIRIDSVNPGLVPGAAGEAAIVAHLRARLERSGLDTSVIGDDRPSLVAVGPDAPATVVLNGHLDTVGVHGMSDPFTPRIEGGRMYGRGAGDMKAGVAACVVVAEALVAASAPVRPVLALVADEEDASVGAEAVIAELPELGLHADLCVIAEPTQLVLTRSLRGFAVVRVTFTGRASHSSQPENGINAVRHMGRLLHAVDVAGDHLIVTVAHGGGSAFVIPDRAECLVEVRTVPGQAEPLAEVRGLLRPEWNAEAELVVHRDPWRMDATGAAAEFAARLGAQLGTDVTFDAPYWMEAPLWQAVCPTVVCGPTAGGLHAVDEWVDLDTVRAYASALFAVLSNWGPRAD